MYACIHVFVCWYTLCVCIHWSHIPQRSQLYAEAGVLYEQAECYDSATGMYVKTKNWDKVGSLLSKVSAPKYHGLYAKAREADGHYKEAAAAFKRAKDYDNFVR